MSSTAKEKGLKELMTQDLAKVPQVKVKAHSNKVTKRRGGKAGQA